MGFLYLIPDEYELVPQGPPGISNIPPATSLMAPFLYRLSFVFPLCLPRSFSFLCICLCLFSFVCPFAFFLSFLLPNCLFLHPLSILYFHRLYIFLSLPFVHCSSSSSFFSFCLSSDVHVRTYFPVTTPSLSFHSFFVAVPSSGVTMTNIETNVQTMKLQQYICIVHILRRTTRDMEKVTERDNSTQIILT